MTYGMSKALFAELDNTLRCLSSRSDIWEPKSLSAAGGRDGRGRFTGGTPSPARHPTGFSEVLASGPQPRAETLGRELKLKRALGWAGVLAKGTPIFTPRRCWPYPPSATGTYRKRETSLGQAEGGGPGEKHRCLSFPRMSQKRDVRVSSQARHVRNGTPIGLPCLSLPAGQQSSTGGAGDFLDSFRFS